MKAITDELRLAGVYNPPSARALTGRLDEGAASSSMPEGH